MSGNSLRGHPQPTASAPAQVQWSGLDVYFLVDFHALGYTKTKGDLPTGLLATVVLSAVGLAVVLGVEAGVEPADALEPAIADQLQQQLAPGEPQGAHVNPHAPADRSACRPARRSLD